MTGKPRVTMRDENEAGLDPEHRAFREAVTRARQTAAATGIYGPDGVLAAVLMPVERVTRQDAAARLAARVTGTLKRCGYKLYDPAWLVLNARFTVVPAVSPGIGVTVGVAWGAAEPRHRDMFLSAMFGDLIQAGMLARLHGDHIYVPLAGNTESRGETPE